MSASLFLDRVAQGVTSTGTGPLTLGAVISGDYFTAAEAGGIDGQTVSYVLKQGNDVEIGTGALGSTSTTLTRTVIRSRIAGVVSTTKITITSGATVFLTITAEDFPGLGMFTTDEFTSTGSADLILTSVPVSKLAVLLSTDGGPTQPPSLLTLVGNVLTAPEVIPAGVKSVVTYLVANPMLPGSQPISKRFVNLSLGPYVLDVTPTNIDCVMVNVGLGQLKHDGVDFTLSGSSVMLGFDPGTDPVEITAWQAVGIGTPANESVGDAQLKTSTIGAFLTKLGLSTFFKTLLGLTSASSIRVALGTGVPDVILEEQQASGTSNGTFTTGAYRTRPLNVKVYDPSNFCTLTSNQFVLAAGTYYIEWEAIAINTGQNRSRLQNVTSTTELVGGRSGYAGISSSEDISKGSGVFIVAAAQTLEIQHQGSATKTTDGMGTASSYGTEHYGSVHLWKVA